MSFKRPALALLIIFLSLELSESFVSKANGNLPRHVSNKALHSGFDPTFLVASIETFDGTAIVDPVVVSDVFWSSMQARILSVVIGQLLSLGVFAVVASLASRQISGMIDYVSSNIFKNESTKQGSSKLRIPPDMMIEKRQIDFGKLLLCLAIDILGTSSELLPLVGELTDIVYAPVAALLLRSLYNSNVVFALEFVEEILPFTDVLPLATLCWVVETFAPASDIARLLRIGTYQNRDSAVAQEEREKNKTRPL